ncbi:MAG: AMP-binding protein [Bacteroidota bacterium]
MNLVFKNEKLTSTEIRTRESFKKISEDYEFQVINIVKNWYSDDDYMEFMTSGSTGISKVIRLSKDQMRESSMATMAYLDPDKQVTHALLCISSSFIGGAMLIIRALLHEIDLIIQKPNASPTIPLNTKCLVSMVPLQVMNSLNHDISSLDGIHTLLIGGAPLSEKYLNILRSRKINAFVTYGMTETASHIALRSVNETDSYYKVLGDTEISIDDRQCLKIRGSITNNVWIQTNDLVEIKDERSFIWIGRNDLIINSGGYKVNPETVEMILGEVIKNPLLIIPEEDELLGQKVILLIESENPLKIDDSIFKRLHPYTKPKRIEFVKSFVYTPSGKIDRIKTAKKYLQ